MVQQVLNQTFLVSLDLITLHHCRHLLTTNTISFTVPLTLPTLLLDELSLNSLRLSVLVLYMGSIAITIASTL